jgi:SAM-dependent methyltransferase
LSACGRSLPPAVALTCDAAAADRCAAAAQGRAMDPVTERVARQYRDYSYPNYKDLTGMEPGGDPSRFSMVIWPEGRPKKNLRILVAGCGAVQAAMLANTNRDCTLVGVDLSETSLAHERFLQEKHGLDNLELHRLDLRDVGKLGRSFDLIFSTGVLHHMPDPREGLMALKTVLEPHGAMFLMLYGAARRYGVYLLQDVFRRLGIEQNPDGVAFVRAALEDMPPSHFIRLYLQNRPRDLEADAGIVDTFLHVQDRAYMVPDVLELVESSGLMFQGWGDNAPYYPESCASPQSRLYQAIAALPDREQWAIVEKINLLSGKHGFFACRPERDPNGYRVTFENDEFLAYIPHRRPDCEQVTAATPQTPARYKRSDAQFSLTAAEVSFFEAADGMRTVAACLDQALGHLAPEQRIAFGRRFCKNIWRRGHMFFSKVPVMPSP